MISPPGPAHIHPTPVPAGYTTTEVRHFEDVVATSAVGSAC
jgi:hypothetical protein